MNNPHNKSVEAIIKELKQANSLDEAFTTLEAVQHLDAQSKATFANKIKSVNLTKEFHLAAQNKDQPFHILHVKALNDITKTEKPQFKVLGTENSAIKKRSQ